MIHPMNCCYTCGKVEADSSKVLLRDIVGKTVETVERLLSCVRCHINLYCSKECQRKDWAKHNPFCIESKSILSKQMLNKTILFHFEKQFQHRISKGRTTSIELGYLMILIETVKTKPVKGAETNYLKVSLDSESYMHLKSELDMRIDGNWVELSAEAKCRLKELKALSTVHPDKLLINVELEEPVANFMFRLCVKISFQELVTNIDINKGAASLLSSLYLIGSETCHRQYDQLSPEAKEVVKLIVNCVEFARFIKLEKACRGRTEFQGSRLRMFGFFGVDEITFSPENIRDLYIEIGEQTSIELFSIDKLEARNAINIAAQICSKILHASTEQEIEYMRRVALLSLAALTKDLENYWTRFQKRYTFESKKM